MRTELTPPFRLALRVARQVGVTLGGLILMVMGLAGLVLPVLPGWILMVAGLGLLATEYTWARRAVLVARRRAHQARLRAAPGWTVRRRRLEVERPAGRRVDGSPGGRAREMLIELEDVIDLREDRRFQERGRDRLAR